MTVPLPGACLRETAVALARRLAARVSPRSADACARLAAFVIVSGAAVALSLPSVLKTMGLGLPASALDILLIALGLVVAADAWSGRSIRLTSLRIAYAGLLVFAGPLVAVRALA